MRRLLVRLLGCLLVLLLIGLGMLIIAEAKDTPGSLERKAKISNPTPPLPSQTGKMIKKNENSQPAQTVIKQTSYKQESRGGQYKVSVQSNSQLNSKSFTTGGTYVPHLRSSNLPKLPKNQKIDTK